MHRPSSDIGVGWGSNLDHNYKKLQELLIEDTLNVKPVNSSMKCLYKTGIKAFILCKTFKHLKIILQNAL